MPPIPSGMKSAKAKKTSSNLPNIVSPFSTVEDIEAHDPIKVNRKIMEALKRITEGLIKTHDTSAKQEANPLPMDPHRARVKILCEKYFKIHGFGIKDAILVQFLILILSALVFLIIPNTLGIAIPLTLQFLLQICIYNMDSNKTITSCRIILLTMAMITCGGLFLSAPSDVPQFPLNSTECSQNYTLGKEDNGTFILCQLLTDPEFEKTNEGMRNVLVWNNDSCALYFMITFATMFYLNIRILTSMYAEVKHARFIDKTLDKMMDSFILEIEYELLKDGRGNSTYSSDTDEDDDFCCDCV